MTVRASAQGASFSMRGQMYREDYLNGRAREKVMCRRDCLRNLDTPFVRQEAPADDNEVCLLEC